MEILGFVVMGIMILVIPLNFAVKEVRTNRKGWGIVAIIFALIGMCISECWCHVFGAFGTAPTVRNVVYAVLLCAVIFTAIAFMPDVTDRRALVGVLVGLLMCVLVFGGIPWAIRHDRETAVNNTQMVEEALASDSSVSSFSIEEGK